MNNLPAQAFPVCSHQGSPFAIRKGLHQKRPQWVRTRCCLSSHVPTSTTMVEMPLLSCQPFLSGVDVLRIKVGWAPFLSPVLQPELTAAHFPLPCQVLIPLHPAYNWIFSVFLLWIAVKQAFLEKSFLWGLGRTAWTPAEGRELTFQLAFAKQDLAFAESFCVLGGLARGVSPREVLEGMEFCIICCSALPRETNSTGNPTHPNSSISMRIQHRCFVGLHQHAAHIPPFP